MEPVIEPALRIVQQTDAGLAPQVGDFRANLGRRDRASEPIVGPDDSARASERAIARASEPARGSARASGTCHVTNYPSGIGNRFRRPADTLGRPAQAIPPAPILGAADLGAQDAPRRPIAGAQVDLLGR